MMMLPQSTALSRIHAIWADYLLKNQMAKEKNILCNTIRVTQEYVDDEIYFSETPGYRTYDRVEALRVFNALIDDFHDHLEMDFDKKHEEFCIWVPSNLLEDVKEGDHLTTIHVPND